ncbi:MAG TPA: tRNA (adenosine(37)-N6)-dimethylallyltransferase MiaA [Candidatus Marinimicrobia bacterium]|nr:tRNA (adenosine(37)-N6)-dimethylallyltransferase MiaA [Candidatus Neomarinimicrobiota bacterium]
MSANSNPTNEVPSRKIPFIVGPTAVGKTATAIELAKQLNGEIISIDSRQVYRGLDIGTAKPTLRQQQEIPHHLVDILDLDEQISAGAYRKLALKTVNEIQSRGKLPIFVGGSGLYVNAVLKGIFKESATNPEIRREIRQELQKKGIVALYNQLLEIDPDTALKIHINDVKRITRALEIYRITGQPPSMHYRNQQTNPPFPYQIFVLTMERELLYQRINARVDEMIASGLVSEVESLLKRGLRQNLDLLMTLGYRQVVQYLDGNCSYDEMVENIKRNTRRYAKRQLTWFRNQYPEAFWIDVTELSNPLTIANKIRQNLTQPEIQSQE